MYSSGHAQKCKILQACGNNTEFRALFLHAFFSRLYDACFFFFHLGLQEIVFKIFQPPPSPPQKSNGPPLTVLATSQHLLSVLSHPRKGIQNHLVIFHTLLSYSLGMQNILYYVIFEYQGHF